MEGTEGATAQEQELYPSIVVRRFDNVRHNPMDDSYGPPQWVFEQSVLSFFEKNELTRVFSGALDYALQGGMSLADIIGQFMGDGNNNIIERLKSGDFNEDDLPGMTFVVSMFLRFVAAVPEMLEETYLIALGVPPRDRDGVRASLRQIDDELGFEIFDCFMAQNGEVLRRFFTQWWQSLTLAGKALNLGATVKKTVTKAKKKV